MGNNWKIVARKWILGTLAAAAVGGIIHLTGLVDYAMKAEDAPAWLSFVGPMAIHYAGLLVNIIKHSQWWEALIAD